MKKTKIMAILAVAATMSLGGALALTGCNGDHVHSYTKQNYDETGHWYECPDDGVKDESTHAEHTFDDESDTTCNDCGYVRVVENDGQTAEKGILSGTVTAYGQPLGGVKVAVGGNDTVTSATGKYSLSDVAIRDSVTVTFTKSGYADKTLTVSKAQWTDNAFTLDAEMTLADEKITVSGVVMAGLKTVEGAIVTIGDNAPVATSADGTYSVELTSEASALEITVTHPACEPYSGSVDISAGATVTKNVPLTAKTVSVIGKTYFELADMQTSAITDFKHVQNTEMWNVEHGPDGYRVITDHGEGICLHVDDNKTADDMVPAIYQKFSVTADNAKMMFRARGFLSSGDKAGLLAVRVVDLTDCSVDDLNAENGGFWQTMDSNGYIQYRYDLSAYKGKDVVIIIGAKQGNHNAIERIRFIGETEEWLMPFVTSADLQSLTASPAQDMNGADAIKNAMENGGWNTVGDQSGANEGWLFKDADYAEEDSEQLRVFAYKKLTFTNTGTIVVRARTFTGQNSVSSGQSGQIYPQIIVRIIDSDGNIVAVNGNLATVDNGESCQNFYITTSEPLNGDYTFVIGMARGQRLAVESILFHAPATHAQITGTVKVGGVGLAEATVSYGYNRGSVTTSADGTFSLPADIDDDIVVTVAKDGFKEQTFTVSKSDIVSGIKNLGDINLSATILPGLTTEDVANLSALGGTTFNTDAIKEQWGQYGNIDKHGEGTCIHLDDNNPVSYVYAKLAITADNCYMKFNARMFVRNEDQAAGLQVKIIKADGTVEILAPTHIYRSSTNVTSANLAPDGKTLINDNDGYTEGAYDLSAYVGQSVVVAVQAVYLDGRDYNGKAVHNAINEIAFKSEPYFND